MTHLIAVVGATGNQGGSVVRSLLQNPAFKVRAITRNPNSDASQALRLSGAEVVQANGFSLDEMSAAFAGVWGAFINLNSNNKAFLDPDGPTELDMGKTIIDAACLADVQHVIFSSGPPCTEMTSGKVSLKAMDSEK
jgi:uncharacterized protein YbjT (DUF2867 family)